jgi:hypothetical protein
MLTEEKIKAVKKALRSGVPQGEIRNQLVNEGYTDADIEKIFTPHPYDMRSWYLIFAIVFFIIGIYGAMVKDSYLFLLFSAGMFYVYYLEKEKHKKSTP